MAGCTCYDLRFSAGDVEPGTEVPEQQTEKSIAVSSQNFGMQQRLLTGCLLYKLESN